MRSIRSRLMNILLRSLRAKKMLLYTFSGTLDILHPEGREFHKKAAAAGHDSHFYQYDQMQHAWLLFPMPETTKALQENRAIIE